MQSISLPSQESILEPLLASLPTAAISPNPPDALLPILSPILRQRVQLFSSAGTEPWLSLLCYDSSHTTELDTIVKSEKLEPHPVSGEVEVDWAELTLRYKRIDEETLQAFALLPELGLSVRLVWCVNDELGGVDGWRVGEVTIFEDGAQAWGNSSIESAEDTFESATLNGKKPLVPSFAATVEDDGEDDDYWNQYDKTPGGETPAPKNEPSPRTGPKDEDEYYAQYNDIQPAMDSHDPDEEHQQREIESSLGRDEITKILQSNTDEATEDIEIIHPRPSSSTSASSVEQLEARAELESTRDPSEVAIRQHIGTSIKSLYRLSKFAGIERDEFKRLVKRELEVLALIDQEDG
ncbi:hypothetical protein BJ878DRAFT_450014 [Calycina marina]|uniref:Uncharacterized protein n=1 Tax=Calycina marina TaxID=1763456 RepID=A0A9P7YUE4_9HELO|nr:hypothetical protein BJ878DRAFT_450014 [Calycina marina]